MLYTIKNGNFEISADTFGAELHSVKYFGKEYLWQCGDSWKRYAPVLFPFVCSPKDKAYKAGGKDYKMKANHGFARDSEFALLEKDEKSVSFVLEQNETTLEQYPYDFKFIVKYSIENNVLRVENFVENTDSKDIYFYVGAHPAFKCPLNDGEKFYDYYVEYEHSENQTKQIGGKKNVFDESGRILKITRGLFDEDAIILDNPKSKSISLKSKNNENSVTVNFPVSTSVAVWSPTGDDKAEFVCLEPWSSVPVYCDDEFEDIEKKPHAISLKPGEKYTYFYTVEIK